MDLTDTRTRKKVTLNPRTVLSNSCVFSPPIHYDAATNSELRILSPSLQNIWTRCYRYRILECPACRLALDDQGMAFIAKRRRVLGPYAHPRVRCLWSGLERGDVGRCGGCVGSCVVGQGTHSPVHFSIFLWSCVYDMKKKSNSGPFWLWAL